MPKYDAFGREIGEDSMSDLGWGATGQPPPPVEVPASPDVTTSPTSVPAPPSTDWSPAQPSGPTSSAPRRRRTGRSPFVWLVQLLVVGGLAAGIYFAVDSGKDAADKIGDAFNTFTVPNHTTTTTQQVTPEDPEGTKPPQQIAARKVFTAQGFQDSLKIMERDTPGQVTNLAMRPDYISYQVQRGNKYTIARLNPDSDAVDVATTQEREPVDGGIRYGQIDVAGPSRIIKGAGARMNKARNDVDYVVLQEIGGTSRWIVYFKAADGKPPRYAIGDEHGRVQQIY